MPPKDDVWVIAKALVGKHGDKATTFAKHQALKAQAKGEPVHADAWRLIADATEQVLHSDRND
jgi:hypothetical protein